MPRRQERDSEYFVVQGAEFKAQELARAAGGIQDRRPGAVALRDERIGVLNYIAAVSFTKLFLSRT